MNSPLSIVNFLNWEETEIIFYLLVWPKQHLLGKLCPLTQPSPVGAKRSGVPIRVHGIVMHISNLILLNKTPLTTPYHCLTFFFSVPQIQKLRLAFS